MTDQVERNGEAAAFGHGNHEHGGEKGLTKREYFAAMAMQGHLANSELGNLKAERIAAISVEQADALLAALESGAQS